MYSFKVAKKAIDVFAVRKCQGIGLIPFARYMLGITLPLLLLVPCVGHTAVNVQFDPKAPAQLQKDFIASATTQFQGSLVSSPYFANTYTLTLSGKNTTSVIPVVDPKLVTLDSLADRLTAISTYTYVTGFANGMYYERFNDQQAMGSFYVRCSTPTVFNVSSIDNASCRAAIAAVSQSIAAQNDGIAVVP